MIVGLRPTRPSQKELDALIAEFQEALLGDVIIQDADPKNPIPGKNYINPLSKPKVSEEAVGGYNEEMFGKNTFLTVKWKLSNVRKAVSAYRFRSPLGHYFDIEDAKHLSPGIWGWLYKEGVPAKAQAYLEATGAAEKEAKRKALKNYSENDVIGTCGICGEIQKLRNEKLVLHGYERPGYGWIEGACFGVGYKAWELSPESAVAFVERLKILIPGQREKIAKIKTSKTFSVVAPAPGPRMTYQIYEVTSTGFKAKPDGKEYLFEEAGKLGLKRVNSLAPESAAEIFAEVKQGAIRSAEVALAQMIETDKNMKAAIAAWKPAPLPGAR